MNLRFRFGPSDLFTFNRCYDLKIELTKSISRLFPPHNFTTPQHDFQFNISRTILQPEALVVSIRYLGKLSFSFLVVSSHELALTFVSRFVYLPTKDDFQHSNTPSRTIEGTHLSIPFYAVHSRIFIQYFFSTGFRRFSPRLSSTADSKQFAFTSSTLNNQTISWHVWPHFATSIPQFQLDSWCYNGIIIAASRQCCHKVCIWYESIWPLRKLLLSRGSFADSTSSDSRPNTTHSNQRDKKTRSTKSHNIALSYNQLPELGTRPALASGNTTGSVLRLQRPHLHCIRSRKAWRYVTDHPNLPDQSSWWINLSWIECFAWLNNATLITRLVSPNVFAQLLKTNLLISFSFAGFIDLYYSSRKMKGISNCVESECPYFTPLKMSNRVPDDEQSEVLLSCKTAMIYFVCHSDRGIWPLRLAIHSRFQFANKLTLQVRIPQIAFSTTSGSRSMFWTLPWLDDRFWLYFPLRLIDLIERRITFCWSVSSW